MSLFDFDQIETNIGKDELKELFTEEQIYLHYYPDFKLGNAKSPFRADNNPSFRFYETVRDLEDKIWWMDQKTGESGSVFSFVQQCYKNFKSEILLKKDVCKRIFTDMQGSISVERRIDMTKIKQRTRTKPSQTILQAILDEQGLMPDYATDYWDELGITINYTNAYHTGYAKELWIIKLIGGERKTMLWAKSTKPNPVYFYYFPHSKHIKAYKPKEKKKQFKWISNITNLTDIQGYYQCDIKRRKPRLLVLTKSMKDIMWLRTIGVDAMGIHGENQRFSKEFIDHLKRHCDFIISVYDNDISGMRGAIHLRNDHSIPCFFFPRASGAKDITDAYKLNRFYLFRLIEELKQHLHDNYDQYTGIGATVAA